ncbi:hypothetical protein IWX77_000055 [Cryobacterium sp. CAN_C2]
MLDEAEYGEGDEGDEGDEGEEGLGAFEAKRDAGDESDLGVHGFDAAGEESVLDGCEDRRPVFDDAAGGVLRTRRCGSGASATGRPRPDPGDLNPRFTVKTNDFHDRFRDTKQSSPHGWPAVFCPEVSAPLTVRNLDGKRRAAVRALQKRQG